MATTIMRDLTVSSPAPATILQSGSVTDENQNNSITTKTTTVVEIAKDVSGHNEMNDNDIQLFFCKYCNKSFNMQENFENHILIVHKLHESPKSESSPKLDSTESPNSKSESFESDDCEGGVNKCWRITRRFRREDNNKRKSDSDSESGLFCRKTRSVNNNYSDDDYQCSFCNRDFNCWTALKAHVETQHPDNDPFCDTNNLKCDGLRMRHLDSQIVDNNIKNDPRKHLHFEMPKHRIDRKTLKNIPLVNGFRDINFMDFSSRKFPLVAKDVCEKSFHLSKDEFCFDCRYCGRGFPCSSALEIHIESCENNKKMEERIINKKNKRKSTPKFRPQALTSDDSNDSTDNNDIDNHEKQRDDFFNSLDLYNTGLSSKSSSIKSEDEKEKTDTKSSDLADIQSMISVTNIPGFRVKEFSSPSENSNERIEEKPLGLNLHITTQSSPSSFSTTSPSFSVINLISPNYSTGDPTEEEAQDCFAAECRRMKLRGEFPCKLCTAVFPNLRALKGHNRVHISVANGTISSPYRCNICTYNSLDKATLVRHMRSHNGDRPYQCAMCNYAFTTKANCERHLRNRHSKMTRDDVKNSIIYHPSEDPVNDADYQKNLECNKRSTFEKVKDKSEYPIPINLKINLSNLREKSKSEDLFQAEHQELLKNISNGKSDESERSEVATMTDDACANRLLMDVSDEYKDEDEALDLSIKRKDDYRDYSNEPEDLSKKSNDEYNNNLIDEKPMNPQRVDYNDVPPTLPYDQKPDLSNLIKFYTSMYPNLTLPQIHQIILTQFNFPGFLQRFHNLTLPSFVMPDSVFHGGNFQKSFLPKDALGLQMSGGSIMDEKPNMSVTQKLQAFQQQALAEILLKREKDRIANNFYKKSHEQSILNSTEYLAEADKKAYQEIIENRETQKLEIFPVKSTVDNRNSSVKMVIKNGVLMPKQKQRRYRTERPFSCEYCSARFTLRSNMERHIKQQHPQHWTHKSRYNVGNRKSDGSKYNVSDGDGMKSNESLKSAPWERDRSPDRNPNEIDSDLEQEDKAGSDEEESKDDLIIDEGSAEREHMRMLANVSEYLRSKSESHEATVNGQPQDLASVSRMLDNAVTQTQAFQKYFQEEVRREEDAEKREDGDRSDEEEGLIAGSTSSDENRSESDVAVKSTKKKSAYSLAPNRVSCPYCFRKFPWTSSLRRHVLTHTGQKPFKCTHCPLLFTTKSNCDRHLLRKHGREALIASNGQTENTDGSTIPSEISTASPFAMRNVPERPFKCSHCPASTFSSSNALSKHISTKHSGEFSVTSSPDERPSTPPPPPRVKNLNPRAPPNVTITPNFAINIPKTLSIIPQYHPVINELKPNKIGKGYPISVPTVRVGSNAEWNGFEGTEREQQCLRKRSSSEDVESPCERKRTSPDPVKTIELSDNDHNKPLSMEQLPAIPASELPFKCHLCEGSFGERNEALDHIRLQHPGEFQLLMSKGALENNSEEDRMPHDDHDDMLDSTRGKFPDYANRKVMCAFCMRRFWSAEDLRRHMRTHTGERPFSCDVCHRRFTLKHSMLRHRKKHTTADEIVVVSDEEHHNNNLPYIGVNNKTVEGEDSIQRTILHQTLTRHDDGGERNHNGFV